MAEIILISVTFYPPPDSIKQVVVSYRKTDDPDIDSSYIIVAAGIWVKKNGEFYQPIVIQNLEPALSYTVKAVSVCGGFSFEQEFTYNADDADFSYGFSLGFTS